MNSKILDLYMKSSENLIRGMELYLKVININKSINTLETNIEHQNRLRTIGMDSKSIYMNTELEVYRLDVEKNKYLEERNLLLTQVNISVLQSILTALELVDYSIELPDNEGIGLAVNSLNSTKNFITKQKLEFNIQLSAILSNIIDSENRINRSNDLKMKTELLNAIMQFKNF